MTIVSFRDAAVLSYLTRHKHLEKSERDQLTETLTPRARLLVKKSAKANAMKSASRSKPVVVKTAKKAAAGS